MRNLAPATLATSIGAFLLPGLALWLLSGYSWGAAWLLITSLLFVRSWWGKPVDARVKLLAGTFLLMGIVWGLSFDSGAIFGNPELAAKYFLAILCLFFVGANAPHICWIWWGSVLGGIGVGSIAYYQIYCLLLARADGYTNAIQFGGISLYIAILSGIGILVYWVSAAWYQRMLALISVFLGLLAATLSDTRGSWIVLPVVLILAAIWLYKMQQRKTVLVASAILLLAIGGLAGLHGEKIQLRAKEAISDVDLYLSKSLAGTSVGQRFTQWKLAMDMGKQKPITGWGEQGYIQEKMRRVQAREIDSTVLGYGHAHNELLDMFAKRGLIGVTALLLFYAVPMFIFWPTRKRCTDQSTGLIDKCLLSIRLSGVLLPICYIGFGLTQVFFAHNSGNMFYLFMLLLLMGTLIRQERDLQASAVGLPVSV